MGSTSISWTSTILPDGTIHPGYSFNPWVGCEKVSPGCAGCYAEAWAKRAGFPELWNGKRRRTTAGNWREPFKWNAKAEAAGVRARVFCASLADVFDNVVPNEWRSDLLRTIAATQHLDWLLLTKRIGNAREMLAIAAERFGMTWGEHWKNVSIGSTVVTQAEADRDIPKLLAVPARFRFLSLEPLLEHVFLSDHLASGGIHQVIVGGESGGKSRPFHAEWARTIVAECKWYGVAPFVKQMGAVLFDEGIRAHDWGRPRVERGAVRIRLNDRKGEDMAEWPSALRIREFPVAA